MRRRDKRNRHRRHPKTKLGLPDLEHSKAAVLNSLRSPESKRGYGHAIDEFVHWYCSEPRLSLNKTVVTRYRIHREERRLARAQSTGGLLRAAAWPMRRQIPACSVWNWRPAYVA
jgi:hypothetical protein